MPHRLSSRRGWVFDLDNTLYPPEVRLFDQIERRMTAYVMEALSIPWNEANTLRKDYWHRYGTTLAGLMREHELDPDPYLEDVHDISFDRLDRDPELRAALSDLPGRRIVYTNGSASYAERVLEARGLAGLFDAVYGIEHADYRPKPHSTAFARVFSRDGLDADRAVMFEDDPRNLEVPHRLGMGTVHVAPQPISARHVQYHTVDLADFLRRILV